MDGHGFEFDSLLADELANRWLIIELLVSRIPGVREREALCLAISDAKGTELRLLQSAQPCSDPDAGDEWPELVPLYPEPGIEVLATNGVSVVKPTVERKPRKIRKNYTMAEKRNAIQAVLAFGSPTEASRRLGIHVSVLRGWVAMYPQVVDQLTRMAKDGEPSSSSPPDASVAPDPPDDFDPGSELAEAARRELDALATSLEEELTRGTPPPPTEPSRPPIAKTPFDPERARRGAAEAAYRDL